MGPAHLSQGPFRSGPFGVRSQGPNGYRLPTETEMNEEILSWSSNDAAGAFSSPLKLSMAGYRLNGNGLITGVGGTYGQYWTSTVNNTLSHRLSIQSSGSNVNTNNRARGYSCRCIKDTVSQGTNPASNTTIDSLSQVILTLDSTLTSITTLFVFGCMDTAAFNYNPLANIPFNCYAIPPPQDDCLDTTKTSITIEFTPDQYAGETLSLIHI
mgnify:CR=1 FL=1